MGCRSKNASTPQKVYTNKGIIIINLCKKHIKEKINNNNMILIQDKLFQIPILNSKIILKKKSIRKK